MDFQTNGTAAGTIPYQYDPSPAAAIIFIVGFGLATIAHFTSMIWWRTGHFVPLLAGCIMSCFGYYGCYWSSYSPHNFGAFVLQSFMLVLAPIFFSATVYVALSRIVDALNDKPPTARRKGCCSCCCTCCCQRCNFSSVFIICDVACFLVQLAGLGLQATTSAADQATGRTVLIIGLVVQCLVTAAFVVMVLRARAKQMNRVAGISPLTGQNVAWARYVMVLGAVGILLLLRNILRVVEYAQGVNGTIVTHEAFLYVFDALPMLTVVSLLLWYHPGRLQRHIATIRKSHPELKAREEGNLPQAPLVC